jgi:hypothetical protein
MAQEGRKKKEERRKKKEERRKKREERREKKEEGLDQLLRRYQDIVQWIFFSEGRSLP